MDKISIMLADDHVVVRESIRKFLEDEDLFQVVGEAGDGESAVHMTVTLKPRVIIMDIDMPGINGIEATRKIKKLCPECSILILTAYDYEQYIFALPEVGASGYLLKDVSARELVNAAKAVYRGESVLHPTIAGKLLRRLGSIGKQEPENPDFLTDREKEVLILAAAGLKNKQIAKKLFVSVRTIEAHMSNVYSKLGVTSRTEAMLAAMKKGWINLNELNRRDTEGCSFSVTFG